MLILSQDKQILVMQPTVLRIALGSQGHYIYVQTASGGGEEDFLGSYHTNERAMEVYTEILTIPDRSYYAMPQAGEKPVIKKCDHTNEQGFITLEYADSNEMRTSDMYCIQCGKRGTKQELRDDGELFPPPIV